MPLYQHFFFFNDTATTEIYTLSLHDALPIFPGQGSAPPEIALQLDRSTREHRRPAQHPEQLAAARGPARDRKSTRLNSSHSQISYAVFCLKKKNIHHCIVATPFLSAIACTLR